MLFMMVLKLFPILTYGSNLWNVTGSSTGNLINRAYRRGVSRSLGTKEKDSISQRLGDSFTEASEKIIKQQTL